MHTDGQSYEQIRGAFRWDIPARFNIAQAICTRHAQATPDAPALVFVEADGTVRTYSFGELDQLSSRFANALAGLGVLPGDIVGVNLAQCPETVIAHIAVTRLGAIVLPLAVLFGPDALRYRLEDSGAKVLITSPEGFERSRAALSAVPALRHTIVVTAAQTAHAHCFWSLLERGAAEHTIYDTIATSPGVMLYTSGTTGQPKGVLHAHRMILASTTGMSFAHDRFPQPGDRMWTPADWAWAGGLNALWTALIHGMPIVAARPAKFDPEEAVDLIARHRVRNVFIPPTALRYMRALDATGVRRRCQLRSLMSGGEALGSDMIAWGKDAFGVTVSEGYGLTEAFIPIGNCPSLFTPRQGSMGQALPGHDIAVLDADGMALQPGERGQLALRRPNPLLFLEYRNRPEATAAKYLGDWCLFGDIVSRDEDGYFWFHGRNDDVIKSSGYRIGPQEVEDCLVQHPAVRLAGVVGTPDPMRGEAVTAFIVLKEDWVLDEGEAGDPKLASAIQSFVRHQLAAHEYPRHIHFITEMPLTVTGKIRRLDLREMAAALAAGNATPNSGSRAPA